MSRHLNIKLLLMLPVVILALAGGVYAIHKAQVRRDVARLLEQANQAEKEGDLEQAAQSLKRYLGYRFDDDENLVRHALLVDKQAETPEAVVAAVMALEQAHRRVPGDRDIQRRAADRLMELGRYDDARTHLESLLGRDEPDAGAEGTPEDGELELLIAQCAIVGEDFEQAAQWYEAAIQHDPRRVESYYQLAELKRTRLDEVDAADQLMDLPDVKNGIIAANGDSAEAFLARSFYRKQFEIEGADQDVARALELAPDDADILVAAATAALGADDLETARRHLERGLELHPEDARMYATMAQVEIQAGRREQGEENLRRGAEVAGDTDQRIPLLWSLANLLIDNAEYDKIPAVKQQLEDNKVRPEILVFLDGRLLMAKGGWSEAARGFEAALPQLPVRPDFNLAYQANLLLGQCYERLGQNDRRLVAFQRAVANDPSGVLGQAGLAATLSALGRIDEALAASRRIANAVPAAKVDVARLMLAGTLSLPEPQRSEQAWQDVDRALAEAAETVPDTVDVPILRAQALAARGRLDAAQDLLTQARDAQPDQVRLWTALASLVGSRGNPDAALAILDEARKSLGDGVDLRLARAVVESASGGEEARKALASLEANVDEFSPEDRLRLLQGLAAVYRGGGDSASAERLLGQIAEEYPNELNFQIALFELSVRDGDEAAMKRFLDKIQKVEGEAGSFWHYCNARYQIWRARRDTANLDRTALAEARRYLAEAARQRPDWSLIPLSRGEIEDLEGNADQAIAGYTRAIELGETRPEVLSRAAQLLATRGRLDEANQVLLKARDAEGNFRDPQIRRLAAEIALRSGDTKQALTLTRDMNLADSKEYRDHLWLGQVLASVEEFEEAEAELRKAVALAGDVPETWAALVQLLARTDRPAAEAAIEEARTKLTGDQAALTLGRLYMAVGQTDQAREQLQTALAVQPGNAEALRTLANLELIAGELPDAQQHLRKLVDLGARDPNAAASARRLLAFLIAAGGNRQQSREALTLLGLDNDVSTYEPNASESIEDLRALAGVLATRQDRASRRASIRVLEHIDSRKSLSPRDQFLLAQLKWLEKDWPAYRGRMQMLIATDAKNPTYLAHYIGTLLTRGDTSEAALWIERLAQVAPEDFPTTALRARMLTAQDKGDEAVKLLESFAEGKDDLVVPVAQLLEGIGRRDAAEQMYRKFFASSQQPEASLVLASFLGRVGRIDEALDLCDRAWQTCDPELVSNTMVRILFNGTAGNEQLQRGASRIEEAAREHPKLTSLKFDLANVLSIWERPEDALAIYQGIYKNDPTKSGPMNNIAWLLALQGSKDDEALSFVNKAIEIDGETTDLLDTRAMVYLATGQPEAAIEDLEDAIALGPTPDKYFHLAQACLAAGERDRATEAFQEAVAIGLEENDLHPLERKAFQQVRAELDSR